MSPDASVMLSGFVGAALVTGAVAVADYLRLPWWALVPPTFAAMLAGLVGQLVKDQRAHRAEVRARQELELRRVAELRGGGR